MHDIAMTTVKQMCQNKLLRWTNHILVRLLQRGISMEDVEHTLLSGGIIEQYPDDYPYPSCLILGMPDIKRNLHVVCGISDTELWLITAYYPDEEEWEPDLKTRKGD